MTGFRCLLALLLATLAVGGCRPRLSRAEQTLVQAWLLCDECDGGERQRVAGLGAKAVPTLAAALRDGPPADRRANMAQQLRDLYGRLGGAAALGVTQQVFITSYLDNYVTSYRTRAALSLGDIATPDAARALEEAQAGDSSGTAPLPGSVRLAVQGAIAAGYPAFTGSLSDSSVGAFDTVTVVRGAAPWDGDEAVSLQGGPFPSDLVVVRRVDTLRFLAVGLPGRYTLAVLKEGPGPARAPLDIQTLRYHPHTPETAPNLAARPFPQRVFLALGRPPAADTIDFFQFLTGAQPLTVSAIATWTGGQDVDLSWVACAGGEVGNSSGLTANKPEKSTVTVPAESCWLLVVSGRGPIPPATSRIRPGR